MNPATLSSRDLIHFASPSDYMEQESRCLSLATTVSFSKQIIDIYWATDISNMINSAMKFKHTLIHILNDERHLYSGFVLLLSERVNIWLILSHHINSSLSSYLNYYFFCSLLWTTISNCIVEHVLHVKQSLSPVSIIVVPLKPVASEIITASQYEDDIFKELSD